MNYLGSCKCRKWSVVVSVEVALQSLNPRVCDCEYCQSHPSAVISHPSMKTDVEGKRADLTESKNGDQLASFFQCKDCGDLLAVGREIDGTMRGAVNAWLLDQKDSLGESIQIQPRFLSASEKLERWKKLWGVLSLPHP
jgi:hypothetical protein